MRSPPKTDATEVTPELGIPEVVTGDDFDAAPAAAPTMVDPLLQHLPMGWASFDSRHRLLAVNPKLAQLYPPLGRPHALGRTLAQVWPEVAHTLGPLIDGVFETTKPLPDIEVRASGANGEVRHFRVSLYPVPSPDNQGLSMAALFDDITRIRHAEEALQQSEAQFRSMFELSGLGKVQCDARTGRMLRVNSRFCQILGYTAAELVGRSFIDITHPEDRHRDMAAFDQLTSGVLSEVQSEKRYIRKDGRPVWVAINVRLIHDDHGHNLCTIASVQDITERRRGEEALRHTTEHNERNLAQLRSIVQAMTEGLVICDLRQHLTFNPAAMEMFGFQEPSPTSAPLELLERAVELRDLDDRRLPVSEWPHVRTLRGETFGNFELKVHLRDRNITRIFSYSGAPVRNAAGEIILGLTTIRDVTEHKAAEDELRQAKQEAEDASRAKDHFLATLSHELRTPLTPVLMVAHALEQDPTLPEALHRDVEMIRRNVELEARLIDDLLDLTRIVRHKLELRREAVDLHTIVEHAVTTCRECVSGEKGVNVRVELDAKPHIVWADSGRMQQVFWNLLSNAMKFTPANGQVIVRSDNPTPDRIRIEVVDSGIGVESDLLESIFNAFEQGGMRVTRRFGGLGLGLAISKALVDLHGGRITAQSEGPGSGATFAVEMPVVPELPSPGGGEQNAAEPGRCIDRGLRILLVEDHATTARVLRRLLEAENFQIKTADSVNAALRIAERNAFDLIISDIGLPDGTGLDLMRALRPRHPHLRGIAVSGFGMEEDLKRSQDAGFARHLVKPVSFGTLCETIREVMA